MSQAPAFSTFVATSEDVVRCSAIPAIKEVLLEPTALALQGTLSQEQCDQLAQEAHTHGLRVVLVWDTLLPQRTLDDLTPLLNTWNWSLYDAVRIADIGAASWLQHHHPTKPIQLLVEEGSHNMHALHGWCELLSPALERFILSIELPEERICEMSQTLPVGCEVMAVGRILLFTSPRSLLAHHTDNTAPNEDSTTHKQAIITSDKSNNRPFPLVETTHGTMMFLDRDQFILDRLDKCWQAGLRMARLDFRHISPAPDACQPLDTWGRLLLSAPASIREQWPRPTRAPFFKVNKTTAQFSRMKSHMHAKRDKACVAEVIAIQNGAYVALHVLRPFAADDALSMHLPTNEIRPLPSPLPCRNAQGQIQSTFEAGYIAVLPWQKKACKGALIRRERQGEPDNG